MRDGEKVCLIEIAPRKSVGSADSASELTPFLGIGRGVPAQK